VVLRMHSSLLAVADSGSIDHMGNVTVVYGALGALLEMIWGV
jgi:hypothetical protein